MLDLRAVQTSASVKRRSAVFTVGYEGRTIAEFVGTLRAAGVDRVVDVRELPLSRRKGFSKTGLSEALAREGISYVHVRAAGNPYRSEKANISKCLKLYAGHLDRHPEVLAEVESAIDGRRAVLLCVEHEPHLCHRGVIADRLATRLPTRRITHL